MESEHDPARRDFRDVPSMMNSIIPKISMKIPTNRRLLRGGIKCCTAEVRRNSHTRTPGSALLPQYTIWVSARFVGTCVAAYGYEY